MVKQALVVGSCVFALAGASAQETGGAFAEPAFGAGRLDVTIGPRLIVPFGPGADAPLRRAELRFGAQWAPIATVPLSERPEVVSLGWRADDGFALRAVGTPLTGPSGLYAETVEGHEGHNRAPLIAAAVLSAGATVWLLTELADETEDAVGCLLVDGPIDVINGDEVNCAE